MLTIACVQVGNYEGRGAEYVDRLRSMVSRHLSLPHRFVCLGEADLPERGWWGKLYMFKAFSPGERVVYFDLDTVIVGSIDELCSFDGEFGSLGDFRPPHGGRIGSALMAWRGGFGSFIYDEWVRAGKPYHPGGDDWWLNRLFDGKPIPIRLNRRYRGQIVSYKFDHCRAAFPEGARVVCYQRRPKPHECEGWVKDHWR